MLLCCFSKWPHFSQSPLLCFEGLLLQGLQLINLSAIFIINQLIVKSIKTSQYQKSSEPMETSSNHLFYSINSPKSMQQIFTFMKVGPECV